MSDLAHVSGERIQLRKGASLEEVFDSAVKRGGSAGSPREPLGDESVRSPNELQAVIDEADLSYADCGRLSVSLDWWNKNSDDPAWEVSEKEAAPGVAS